MKFPSSILLAAGHGGRDSGAVSPDGRHNERDQTIIIVEAVVQMLRESHKHIVPIVAPHNLDTHETIPWMNERYRWGEVWAVEIHRDSADTIREPAASLRCGIYHGSSNLSMATAEKWLTAAVSHGAHHSSWARNQNASRHTRLGWITQPRALSHLIELGFMEGDNSALHLARLARICANSLADTVDAMRGA